MDDLNGRMGRGIGAILKTSREVSLAYQARLSAFNPEAILKLDLAVLTAEDGSTV